MITSGKQKTSAPTGKVSPNSDKLAHASNAVSEDNLSLPFSALKAELGKNQEAILTEIHASLSPINSACGSA